MKAFEEGKKGFSKNGFNPYNEGTQRYREWERGYNKAYFQNLERVQIEEGSKSLHEQA